MMSARKIGAQPRSRGAGVQGGAALLALALAGLLGGCATFDPAGWFHRQEGGVIAQQKGPLPGENEPYPNLATVPPVPTPPDLAALRQISAGLVADRAHARMLEEAAPLPDPSRPSTAPGLFGVGSLPPPVPPAAGGAAMASASMPAVTAAPEATPVPARPAAAPRPPAKAPVAPVQSAALPPPVMPTAPPPPPTLGQAGSAVAAAPAAPAAGKPAAPPAVPGPAADRVVVRFPPGSTGLPPAALPELRALAARRGGRTIVVLGQGDVASAAPAAQLAAVKLGLARAQAIAASLQAAGVPGSAIRVRSDASGSEGIARLE